MYQRLVIRLLPIEIFILSLLAGWLAIGGVRSLLGTSSTLLPSAQLAQAAGQILVQPAGSSYGLSPIFTPEVQYWAPQISKWAAQYQLDPNLIATVMQIESCGAPGVASGSGA